MGLKSSRLTCPNGYDRVKFARILEIFDALDANGDRIIDKDEMFSIFINSFYDYYVSFLKEQLSRINDESEDKIKELQQEMSLILNEKTKGTLSYENKLNIVNIHDNYSEKIEEERIQMIKNTTIVERELYTISLLSKEERCIRLIERINAKKWVNTDDVEFNDFFKFMSKFDVFRIKFSH